MHPRQVMPFRPREASPSMGSGALGERGAEVSRIAVLCVASRCTT